ncbi:hypothetical protein [Vreelandella venusta]|uniref:hypothetical protein n=1 Tax=Vreelandella venusta TaxID=44935 RepID=UPI0011BDE09C|nr:hypothetical protein [Halomonas venusta]
MKLTLNLCPLGDLPETQASLIGVVLTINGVSFDLSELPDGAVAHHHSILGKVTRNGDEYECTIRLGHGPNAPYETRFPRPIVLENHNGPIELPLYDVVPKPEEVTE